MKGRNACEDFSPGRRLMYEVVSASDVPRTEWREEEAGHKTVSPDMFPVPVGLGFRD
jgi:hypothetical protein